MCHHAKFRQNQPNGFVRYNDFSIFKMAAGFSNFSIFGFPSVWEG